VRNLADLYKEVGKRAQAEPLYRQTITIQKKYWGNHPDYAKTLNNLGVLYFEMEEYARQSRCVASS